MFYSFVCFSFHFMETFLCRSLPVCITIPIFTECLFMLVMVVCVCVLALQIFEYKFFTPLGTSLVTSKKKEKKTTTAHSHIRENYFAYEQQERINTCVRIRCLFSHIFICCLTFSFIIIFSLLPFPLGIEWQKKWNEMNSTPTAEWKWSTRKWSRTQQTQRNCEQIVLVNEAAAAADKWNIPYFLLIK